MAYKCKKCGSTDVEAKIGIERKFNGEVEVTEEEGLGSRGFKTEEPNKCFLLYCKSCKLLGERDKFEEIPNED